MTIKYPSIDQFKNVIRRVKDVTYYVGKDENGDPVYDKTRQLPKLEFFGTVKIHGTNAGIRLNFDGSIVPQSRERDLSLESDNAGFYVFVMQREQFFKDMISKIAGSGFESAVLYGEWAGKGVQKGVAVSEIDKKLFVFGVRVNYQDKSVWLEGKDVISIPFLSEKNLDVLHANEVYLITEFPTWEFVIDFENPESIQNQFVDIVDRIESECPVGKSFGVSGVGEGIVISHQSDKYGFMQFKCKGEKHSNSKVKSIAPVDELAFNQAKEFATNYTTQARLEQGIYVLTNEHQLDMSDTKNIGPFLKWVSQDIFKEEQQSILDNNLDPKKVAHAIQNIARNWFLNRV